MGVQYVKAQISGGDIKLRISMSYFEMSDMVDDDVDEILKAEKKELFNCVHTLKPYEKREFKLGDHTKLEIDGDFRSYSDEDLGRITLNIYAKGHEWGTFQINMTSMSGAQVVKNVGLTKVGVRRVLVYKAELINGNGVAVSAPASRKSLENMGGEHPSNDPFFYGDTLAVTLYKAPSDLIQLLDGGASTKKLLIKGGDCAMAGDVYNISQALVQSGIPITGGQIVLFIEDACEIVAFTSGRNSDIIENLISEIGQGPYQSYALDGGIYEIDDKQTTRVSLVDMLGRHPKLKLSLGLCLFEYDMAEVSSKLGELAIEANGCHSGGNVVTGELKLSTDTWRLEKEFEVECQFGEYAVVKLSQANDQGRQLVLVIRCEKMMKDEEENE